MKTAMALVLFFSFSAFAQKSPNSKEQPTRIEFEEDLVEGRVKNPDLSNILERKSPHHSRLIKLRENFVSELRASQLAN